MARTKATARYRHNGMIPRKHIIEEPNADVESRLENEQLEIETHQEREQEDQHGLTIASSLLLNTVPMNGTRAPPTTPRTPTTPKTVEKQRFVDPAYSGNDGSLVSTCLKPEFKMMTPRKRTCSRAIRYDQVRRRLFDEGRASSEPKFVDKVRPHDLNLALYHSYNYPPSTTRSGKVYQCQF